MRHNGTFIGTPVIFQHRKPVIFQHRTTVIFQHGKPVISQHESSRTLIKPLFFTKTLTVIFQHESSRNSSNRHFSIKNTVTSHHDSLTSSCFLPLSAQISRSHKLRVEYRIPAAWPACVAEEHLPAWVPTLLPYKDTWMLLPQSKFWLERVLIFFSD